MELLKALLLSFFVFLLAPFPTHADSHKICKNNHDNFDLQMQGPIVEKFRCPLFWDRGEFKEGMEFAYFKNGCRRYEGGPLVSCFQMRTCSNKPGFKPSWGTMFYLDGKGEVVDCKLGKIKSIKILGNSFEHPKKDFSATIPCEYPIKYVVYSGPNKEKKICPFPPML